MFIWVGKVLTWACSPYVLLLLIGWYGVVRVVRCSRSKSNVAILAILTLITALSMPITARAFLGFLERDYPKQKALAVPKGDVIITLGGGMSYHKGDPYPDCSGPADRVWHAARLYHAKRAPKVLISGLGESRAAKPFLIDLGVPASAIISDDASRTTHENMVNSVAICRKHGYKRILLVTSAWHLRRATMLYEKAGVKVIPVGTDYLSTPPHDDWNERLKQFLPSIDGLRDTTVALKEIIGYWVYRYLRS